MMKLSEKCLSRTSRLLRGLSFVYWTLVGLVFFDYQLITMAEIAFMEPSKIWNKSMKFTLSLVLSIFMSLLILNEMLGAVRLINEDRNEIQKLEKAGNDELAHKALSPVLELVLEKYTEGIDSEELKKSNFDKYKFFVVFSNARFFVIQVVIVTLQHLNRTQSVIVLMINLTFFIYFSKAMLVAKVFESKIHKIKEIVQEICIMVFISTITLFSFTQKTSFASSKGYKLIELVTIISIVGACGTELLILISELGGQLLIVLKKLSKRCSKSKRNEVVDLFKYPNNEREIFGARLNKQQQKSDRNIKKEILSRRSQTKDVNPDPFSVESEKPNPEFSHQGQQEKSRHDEVHVSQPTKISILSKNGGERGRKIDISIKEQPKVAKGVYPHQSFMKR